MPLSTGERLGPYEILSAIGAGGMGEVYKARDTRLDRTVAVKVLPEHIAKRDDVRARFEREARAVASLNHPNICTLHDIGPGYMVMELIEGETLAARIGKGALPLDQALKLAAQIADALDRAHRAGVTHRDVKPQNIMLTRDGVKVLDFGLAKSAASKPASVEETLTKVLTTEGTVMGTPQYMAPEQFAGKEADARSDIWAFGAVLYEMVTGRKAFQGANYQSLVGAILATDPAPMAVKPFTPSWLERLVRRCLAKDPDDRYQAMRDIVLDLRTPPQEAVGSEPSKASRWPWMAAVVAAVIAIWLAVAHFGEKPVTAPLVRTTMLLPPNVTLDALSSFAVSPDGKRIAFNVRNSDGTLQLWLRPLDGIGAQPLAGTEGAIDPFWSPEGQSIGFFAGGKLKRIEAAGGTALTLAEAAREAGNVRGASWGSRGVIVFYAAGKGLQRVSATGGAMTDATKRPAGGITYRRPSFLPDGKHFVFVAGAFNSPAPKAIRLGSLDGPESTQLIEAADSGAVYAAGYLLFLRGETLMAQPFDARRLALTGEAVPVVENVPGGGIATLGGFSASSQGLLVHASGAHLFSDLAWFDRKGNRTPVPGEPASFKGVNFSNDRTSLVVSIEDQAHNLNAWIVDLARGLRTRLTSAPAVEEAILSPDGRTAFYASNEKGHQGISRKPANGTGSEELLCEVDGGPSPWSISPDGRFLLYSASKGSWILPDPLGAPGKLKPYAILQTSNRGQFSPDGHWIAYESSESGRDEIYVTPFPAAGAKRQISTGGGTHPRWRGDGREIFYVAPDGQIAAVEVAVRNSSLEAGATRMLFNPHMPLIPPYTYDVSADGQRILAIMPRLSAEGLTIVQNWPALLKK